MSKLLITGGTGFLGSWILDLMARERAAARLGFDTVRVMARDPGRAASLAMPDAQLEVVQGDLENPASLTAAAAGVDTVLHVAALYDTHSRWARFYRANVVATRELILGLAPGSRFVLTSTYGVYGFPRADGITEDYEPKRPIWHYQKTKKMQEDLARALCRERGIRFVALRPPTVIGPRELLSVPTMIRSLESGSMMLVGDGHNRIPIAHASDAARAHLLALERIDANDGEAFHFASFHTTFREYVDAYSRALGLEPVRRKVPRGVAAATGFLGDALGLLGVRIPYTGFSVAYVSSDGTLDQTRIRARLGFEPTYDLERTVRESVEWYLGSRPRGR